MLGNHLIDFLDLGLELILVDRGGFSSMALVRLASCQSYRRLLQGCTLQFASQGWQSICHIKIALEESQGSISESANPSICLGKRPFCLSHMTIAQFDGRAALGSPV